MWREEEDSMREHRLLCAQAGKDVRLCVGGCVLMGVCQCACVVCMPISVLCVCMLHQAEVNVLITSFITISYDIYSLVGCS